MTTARALGIHAARLEKQAGFGKAVMQFAKQQAPKLFGTAAKQAPKAVTSQVAKQAPKTLQQAAKQTSKAVKHVGNPTGKTGPQLSPNIGTGLLAGTKPTKAIPTPPPAPKNTYMKMPKNTVRQGLDIDALPDWLQSNIRELAGSSKNIPRVIDSLKMDNSLYKIFKHFGY